MRLHSSSLVLRYPVAAFVILSYGLSWIIVFPAVMAVRDQVNIAVFSNIPEGLTFLVRFGPLIAAIVVSLLTGGIDGIRKLADRVLHWRVGFQWYLIALALPAFLVYHIHFRDKPLGFDNTWMRYTPVLSFTFLSSMFIGGGQQQIGWCGFALPKLLARTGALKAGIVLGLFQSFWHLPYLYNSWAYRGTAIYVTSYVSHIIAIAVIGTWLFNSSGGSVLIVALFNASMSTFGKFLTAEPYKLANPFSLLVCLEIATVIFLVAVFGSKHLSRSPAFSIVSIPHDSERTLVHPVRDE
ncbi:hypothetical protein LLG96_19555 [bacterium]|nr:hypothetical protein [bacterium]